VLAESLVAGRPASAEVTVVNDMRLAQKDARLRIASDGEQLAEAELDIPAGGLIDVEALELHPPSPGPLSLTVTVDDADGGRLAENRYELDVLEPVEVTA
jgi:hypothetical protein